MSPLQMKTMMFFIAQGFGMTLFLVFGFVAYLYGQCLEPYFVGYVVHIPQADQIWRGYVVNKQTKREVELGCFRFHGLRKLLPAISPKYAFEVETSLSDKIPVAVYVSDQQHQATGEDLGVHPVNTSWDRYYCFEMPGTISDDQAIRVTGHSEHSRIVLGKPFPFWKSRTPVPEFVMAPEMCYEPGRKLDKACGGS